MTAVSNAVTLGAGAAPAPGLPRRAGIFLVLVAAATVAAAAPPIADLSFRTGGWFEFLALASAAAVAQLFVARTPRNAARY